MTKRKKPSTDEPKQPAPAAAADPGAAEASSADAPADAITSALRLIQEALPEIARTMIALAKSGNTTAAALCLRIGDPHRSLLDRLTAHLTPADMQAMADRLSDDDLSEIRLILADAGVSSCGTMPSER